MYIGMTVTAMIVVAAAMIVVAAAVAVMVGVFGSVV